MSDELKNLSFGRNHYVKIKIGLEKLENRTQEEEENSTEEKKEDMQEEKEDMLEEKEDIEINQDEYKGNNKDNNSLIKEVKEEKKEN